MNRLTSKEIESLQVLFLARYAPLPTDENQPELHQQDGVFPRYNYELFHVLRSLGLQVTACRDVNEFLQTVKHYNYVFTIYNRIPMRNPEVFVPTVCEYYGVPYLGAPPNIRALAEDKYFTKVLANFLGIPTAPCKVYANDEDRHSPPDFAGPYLIKPRFGAASETISINSVQDTWAGAQGQIQALFEAGKECMVERCIPGTDLTIPVLGGDSLMVLPCAEEVSELPYGISTHRQKRLLEGGRTRHILEDKDLSRQIEEYVRRFCVHIQPFDYVRIDFRLSSDRKLLSLLEFNVCCNLGSHAAIALAARHQGISHVDLINHIVSYSTRRQAKGIFR